MADKVKKLAILVGPPGSGKSTTAKNYADSGYEYINQDLQGKEHLALFDEAILEGKNVVVDRMNFSKGQRARYLELAKSHGYFTSIVVIHESYQTCLGRMLVRTDHATIKDEKSARSALHTFFTKYERVEDSEADDVVRVWPGPKLKPLAIICDLDGTLCNVEHRRHFVRSGGKKNWPAFFDGIKDDELNTWCFDLLKKFSNTHKIVLCSGRGREYKDATVEWLKKFNVEYDSLFMRSAKDSRSDYVIKQILLEFEIKTRYKPYFAIDDRDQVVKMWRDSGIVCLQCDWGNF